MSNNNTNDSRIMLAIGLYMPIDISDIFNKEDLTGNGVEVNSHITLLYSPDKIIPKEGIIDDIESILGKDCTTVMSAIKNDNFKNIMDFFDLSYLSSTDSEQVILEMKKDSDLYNHLQTLYKGLKNKYDVKTDFPSYITLAEVEKGLASKYLKKDTFVNVLNSSKFDLEDFMISYGGHQDKDKIFYLTHYKNVDRYFRIERLKNPELKFK